MRDNRNPPLASPFSRGSAIRSANRFHCRSNIFVLESFLYIINVQIHRQVPKSIPGNLEKYSEKIMGTIKNGPHLMLVSRELGKIIENIRSSFIILVWSRGSWTITWESMNIIINFMITVIIINQFHIFSRGTWTATCESTPRTESSREVPRFWIQEKSEIRNLGSGFGLQNNGFNIWVHIPRSTFGLEFWI